MLLRKRRGFSMVEMLMVIAIIGIIATVAIPLLLSSRRYAMDEKARQSLRTVLSAQQSYFSRHGQFGTLDELANADPPYLDTRFSTGSGLLENGLTVTLTLNGLSSFDVVAVNPAGNHDYASDESFDIEEL
jgi:prepilin-type N-terminal cleavage/methylation domain-containing protein